MRLRRGWGLFGALAAFGLLASAPAADVKETKSALESDATGWTDIMPGKDLKGWKRVPIPPDGKLNQKNPWSLSDDGQTLHCDGVGIHEMLLYDKELADFIFHAEWNYKPVEGKKGYNSGVYARNSADGAVWHQAQVGDRNVGYFFGTTLVDGKPMRMQRIDDKVPQRGKPPSEWNVFEITCKGKTMTLWVNGAVTATWNDCQVPKGHVGLEAEGWFISFRNLKVKELK